MNADEPDNNFNTRDKVAQLTAPAREARKHNPAYSKIVRRLRLILPTIAFAIMAIVFTWGKRDEPLMEVTPSEKIETVMGKNELINPRFEGSDEKNQPYTLTADRAVQDEKDSKLILLEKPKADLAMNGGNWVAFESTEGAFQQAEGKILLRGGVRFFHDGGYQMDTPELHININDETAITDKDVHVQGPEGTLTAKGLEGRNKENILIFKGPAKLVLNTKTLGTGGLFR